MTSLTNSVTLSNVQTSLFTLVSSVNVGQRAQAESVAPARINVAIYGDGAVIRRYFKGLADALIEFKVGDGAPKLRWWLAGECALRYVLRHVRGCTSISRQHLRIVEHLLAPVLVRRSKVAIVALVVGGCAVTAATVRYVRLSSLPLVTRRRRWWNRVLVKYTTTTTTTAASSAGTTTTTRIASHLVTGQLSSSA